MESISAEATLSGLFTITSVQFFAKAAKSQVVMTSANETDIIASCISNSSQKLNIREL